MIEKVNPAHPDKIADRIAGAFVDLAYSEAENPKVAIEVLIGHRECHIIAESSVMFTTYDAQNIVRRIAGDGFFVNMRCYPQDVHLAHNQVGKMRCGDNGIFKGAPLTGEEENLGRIARHIFAQYPTDGKYILADNRLVICQSQADSNNIQSLYPTAIVNPLGDWDGGTDVDTGATNRKLGSDMAGGVTGGGLHGKDLSKADVSVNIYAFIKAQRIGAPVELHCHIGQETIDGRPYADIVDIAREHIANLGGFEKFAEWGLF